jgi:ABC-type Zn2+ transport system substrate-binding protein/surface adhesin
MVVPKKSTELEIACADLIASATAELETALQKEVAWREELQFLTIDQAVEIGKLRETLRQILNDPDAHILDSHRDDGWAALARKVP